MLDLFKGFLKRQKPSHVGFIINGNVNYAKKNNLTLSETYKLSFDQVNNMISEQVKLEIPIFTFKILSPSVLKKDYAPTILEELTNFFNMIPFSSLFLDNQIRVSIFGKWYELPGNVVEKIKIAIDRTKDFDKHYVNFCINYNGHNEIVDASKVIARKIKAEKIEVDQIMTETVKENLYNSFIGPDLIIKTGKNHKLRGFLLWDSFNSEIYFSDKYWPQFEKKDLYRAMGCIEKKK